MQKCYDTITKNYKLKNSENKIKKKQEKAEQFEFIKMELKIQKERKLDLSPEICFAVVHLQFENRKKDLKFLLVSVNFLNMPKNEYVRQAPVFLKSVSFQKLEKGHNQIQFLFFYFFFSFFQLVHFCINFVKLN